MNVRMKCALWLGLSYSVVALAEGPVDISGSNTFGEELGPRLIGAYQTIRPAAEFALGTEGSGTGIQALLDGACDIASSSRALSEEEKRMAASRGMKLRHDPIGYYGIALVVHERNPVANLSDRQIRGLFTGAITNWAEAGGLTGPVHLCIRDAAAGTHLGFRELAMKSGAYGASAQSFPNYPDLIKAVAADEFAVGYVGMGLADRPGVHTVSINGIPANSASVYEEVYPYVRLVRLYTDRGSTNKTARSFIRFCQSKAGQRIVEECGFVPYRQSAPWH
jgi:phosphate transport system substrate-binding protein